MAGVPQQEPWKAYSRPSRMPSESESHTLHTHSAAGCAAGADHGTRWSRNGPLEEALDSRAEGWTRAAGRAGRAMRAMRA